PWVLAGVNVIAADTEADARRQLLITRRARLRRFIVRPGVEVSDAECDRILASPQGAQIDHMMKHQAVGTPGAVREQLEAFAAFASDLDEASKAQLERGARLVELLKQPQYTPYPVEDQVVSIWAGTTGKLDEVPVEDILRFEREFLDFLGRKTKILSTLRETNVLDDKTVEDLEKSIVSFKQEFQTGEGKSLASVGREEFVALPEGDVHQEKIVKKKR
ncbi:MAG: hypothetical protein EBR52_09010, partial [Microbacteriaceae bacterium]|nr:hypothetical protein [Microbacteriaceae bacterium]